jgi:glycerate kinase
MNIVIAPDSFKDCLSAKKVAESIAKGIQKVNANAIITQIPISDGGEGLLDALVVSTGGKLRTVKVKDPLLRNINAQYGVLRDGITAVIEMATASGLELLEENERNPLRTSTFGTGQLISDALDRGCKKIIIGLGGSATNDGGMGMIQALGGKFLNAEGTLIGDGGGVLDQLYSIDLSDLDKRLGDCEITGACDVSNPLTGPEGASVIYGGQKGGQPHELKQLDNNLVHYASILKSDLKKDVNTVSGAGAAGGMGAALFAYFNAELRSGIELIIEILNLEKYISNADLVFTGEGKIDHQTLYGKTISGVAMIGKKHKIPVIAIAGKIGDNIEDLFENGVTAVFSIVNKPMSLEESILNADELIQSCVQNILRAGMQ